MQLTAKALVYFLGVAAVFIFGTVGTYVLGHYGNNFSQKINTVFDAAYFTLITVSTVGYGDITPITDIAKLFVNNDFRNIGVGKKLVNTAVEWQKEMHSEVIFVTTDEAQEFYKKLGFKELRKNSWLCLPLI